MALFPQGLSQIDQRCNAGERRVLHQLKRCLEDDYIVWHDVPIGPRARQPDFVILSPRWGVLLLEVKDWRRSTLVGGSRDAVELSTARGLVTQAHPLRQARDCTMELVDLMQRDPALVHESGPFSGKLLFPYGWGVVMASLRADDIQDTDFRELFPTSRTLLRDELEPEVPAADFQHRLWGMFTVTYPCTLTLPQRDRVRWHLFPEVRLSGQAELSLDAPTEVEPALPDLLQVMDLQQEQIARTLGHGHRVIHGAAGSGKTMILVFRAQHLAAVARPDRPILVMCFNRTLATRIESLLRQRGVDERVIVRTFHAWCQDMARTYQLGVSQGLRGDAYFEALAKATDRALETGLIPGGQYLALLIDEAHDFEDAWLRMATRLVSPETNSLLVLYDDAQSIYQARRRKFNFASVGIEARGRTSVLRLNYRNTAEVLTLAMGCAQSLLRPGEEDTDEDRIRLVEPASAGRRGPMPVFIETADIAAESNEIAARIDALRAEGCALQDVAVLLRSRQLMLPVEHALRRRGIAFESMRDAAMRRFDWSAPSVKVVTMHSAKGLEFPHVFVAGLQSMPMGGAPLDEELRLLYVAMTRATQTLVASASGDSPIAQRVRQSLQQTQARFAMQSG